MASAVMVGSVNYFGKGPQSADQHAIQDMPLGRSCNMVVRLLN